MSSFSNMAQRVRTRHFGGTNTAYTCEPYVSGYGFIRFFLPVTIQKYLEILSGVNSSTATNNHHFQCPSTIGDAQQYLSQACVAVTPPTNEMTDVTHDASTGVVVHNIGKIKNGYTVNVKYLEMTGLPIFKIHKAWIEYMRDARNGYKVALRNAGQPTVKSSYTGNIYYWTTKPDGVTVEYAALYSGVFPSRDVQDNFSFDIASNDKVECDYQYTIDYIWNAPWVFENCQKYAKQTPFGNTGNTLWGGFQTNTKEPLELKESK